MEERGEGERKYGCGGSGVQKGNPFRASLPMSERSRDAAKSANAAPQNELYAACSYACVCVCVSVGYTYLLASIYICIYIR